MKSFKIDLVKLLKGYSEGWVGISSDFKKVVVDGKTLQKATERAKNIKDKVYFFPVGQNYDNFIGVEQ